MTRETLDRRIRHLLDEILLLDSMVEQSISASVAALKSRNMEAARQVYAGDQQINARRFSLENETMVVLATQQPVMAHDLRQLASILEVTGELERIGDYGKGIAKIALILGDQPPVKPLIDIPRMAVIAVEMLHQAVSAFVTGDADAARAIPLMDDQVDRLYNSVYHELVQVMIQDPRTIDRANYLMWAAHNLERMADRVTNICERTIYLVTGELKEVQPSDDELLARQPLKQTNPTPRKVLFLCTGNSSRSQMAEGIVNALLGEQWQAVSAGTIPAGYVHPLAQRVLAEIGIQHEGRSKLADEFRNEKFDLVVTVCDSAAEECPLWLGPGVRVHHSFADPAKAQGSEEEVLQVFREVRDQIAREIPEILHNWVS